MRRILLILVLNIYCNIILADNIGILPEPGWLYKTKSANTKPVSLSNVSNGYYLELADHQVNLGTQTEYLRVIRHIVNESGVQNASEASVTYAPEFQKVVFHKVTLLRGDKIVSQLKPGQIKVVQEETDASDFQYNGLKRAFVILKGVQKEDRIEIAYSIIGFNPVFGNHYSDKIYFINASPITNYFETLIAPASRTLAIKSFNDATAPSITQQGDQQVYHWNNPPLTVTESQPGTPGWFDNYPFVTVTEFDGWKAVVDWGVKLFNNYQYPITGELKTKISQWREQAKGDKDLFANMATRFVQDQVRYLGLEIGTYTHQPHAPAAVLRQRFGDCKDKALLLATILQQENIPAYVALVNTTTRSKLKDATPSASQFDHAIVAIERSSGYIYVDATMSYQRGELASVYIPDYGYALLLREGQTELQPIEAGEIYSTVIVEKLFVARKDSCRLRVNTVFNGGAADITRASLAEVASKDLEDSYRDYYIKNYEGIQVAKPVVISDDSSKNELTVEEDYIMPSLWHEDSKGKKSIEIFAKSVYEQVPDPANAYAGAPFALVYPRDINYTIEISMPENWAFDENEYHVKTASYQFDFEPEVRKNIVTLRYRYKTFKDHIPADEVAKYKTDYNKIEELFDYNMFYTNSGSQSEEKSSAGSTTGQNVNWLMVFLALAFCGGFTFLLRHFNKKSADVMYSAESGWPIGGWVVVLGITLALGAVLQIFRFTQNDFFNLAAWKIMGEQGGPNLQLVLVAEMGISLLWICAVAALMYWFIQRRDIFPRMFMGYMGSLIAGQLLLVVLYSIVKIPEAYGDLRSPLLLQVFRTGIYAAIWGSYVLRSERVKSTFLQPFR